LWWYIEAVVVAGMGGRRLSRNGINVDIMGGNGEVAALAWFLESKTPYLTEIGHDQSA
jgi:hypothetical protein